MPRQHHNGMAPAPLFYAAYIGPSMNPTLLEPEMMEIRPYDSIPHRIGDVAFFHAPGSHQPVVHRIVQITPAGISTLGDNNSHKDPYLLQPSHIRGQVVAAWRGQKRRTIAGGLHGRLFSYWARCRLTVDRTVSPLLHPLYQALSHKTVLARFLPAPLRPRIVVFRFQGRDQHQLLLGKRIIGRYDAVKQQWQIQRPFHLVFDGRAILKQQDKDQSHRHVLTAQRVPTDPAPAQSDVLHLSLRDGTCWDVSGDDPDAAAIVKQLGLVMQIPAKSGSVKSPSATPPSRLLVQVDAHTTVADCYVPLASENDGAVLCILSPCNHWGGPHVNLMRLALIFARESQARGGVLIHGALAERDGLSVILTAPGGTGKTTASNRFPAPWRSLCDDTTLVVRDPQGTYWAHPWPTWSRFPDGGPGGTWAVQDAVPLKGIFVLSQAAIDRAERVGPGHAVSMLVESVRQATMFMPMGLFKEEVRALHLERFDNLCALARVIPAYVLHISLTGAFWNEIDKALED